MKTIGNQSKQMERAEGLARDGLFSKASHVDVDSMKALCELDPEKVEDECK